MIRGILLAYADYRGLIDGPGDHGFRIRSTGDGLGGGIPPRSTHCWVPLAGDWRDGSWNSRLSASYVLFG